MRKSILFAALLAGMCFGTSVYAKSVALTDLKDFSIENVKKKDTGKAFDSNHWAYRTLKNVTDKYGVLIGKPGENFDGTRPISRNEAAIILVNLMGKVEDQNIKMSEAEKAKIEILQQELSGEMTKLSGRVEAVEKSVAELKGSVSNIEESNKKSLKTMFGDDFKITGGLQAGYTAMPCKGADGYSPNFGLPYSELAFTGKVHEHMDYVAQLVPTRNFSDTTFNGLLREAYVSTDIIPKHKLFVGQVTRPIGQEAILSPLAIDFIDYSQSSRKLLSNNTANYDPHNQDTGVMITGDWAPVKYSIGTFNGTGNNSFDGNRRTSLAAQATVRPFYKTPSLGSLELGGSILNQNTSYRENLFGYHASYTYKRFNVKGEYLAKTGFNNVDPSAEDSSGNSLYDAFSGGNKARGFVLDAKYNLTDKIAVLFRYDNFDPDIKNVADASTEYVAGINYLFKDNLGLLVNFANVSNQSGRDSHRVGFLTQYMF